MLKSFIKDTLISSILWNINPFMNVPYLGIRIIEENKKCRKEDIDYVWNSLDDNGREAIRDCIRRRKNK